MPLFHTLLGALGPASDEAVARLRGRSSRNRPHGPLDGVILFLHGACWAAGYEDVERPSSTLFAPRRPSLPIAVALDYHGNIDRQTLRGADIAVAYRHSRISTWARPASARRGPCCACCATGVAGARGRAPGVVIPSIMSATALEPLASIIAEARAAETAGDCDISVMGGFSYADSANTGMSVICLDWDGQARPRRRPRPLSARLRAATEGHRPAIPFLTVDEALADSSGGRRRGRPIVLLEHADRMNN